MAQDNINQLENRIIQMLDNIEPAPSSECCIYRVPTELRKVNEEAYTPHVVSIGPFHRYNKKLLCMDQVKKRYTKKFLRMSTSDSCLKTCIEFIRDSEEKIRNCYSEHIEMESGEFVTMILVDSCFIVQLLKYSEDYDPSLFLGPGMWQNINFDLILLENQVPFFVLEGLYTRASDGYLYTNRTLLDMTLEYFMIFNRSGQKDICQSVKHLTDLVLTLSRPSLQSMPPPSRRETVQCLYSAKELHEAGVTFEKSSRNFLFEISFNKKNGVLTIPSFSLYDETELYIRNLMALELCMYENFKPITDYIFLMDCLINTTRDVELLVHKKIIVHSLGDNQAVADLFNRFSIGVTISEDYFYFSEICKDLNTFYESPFHKLKATLKQDYFPTPWRGAATIAAIMLLVLTFIQTMCTIISIIH